MKKSHLIFVISLAVILAALPFGIYITLFQGDFSLNNADWGSFGSFIGGISGALLSTLSLLVLIYTLHVTITNFNKQLTKQQENHEQQLKLQREIHNTEFSDSRFMINIQFLNNYIDILNKKLDKKLMYIVRK